jgi:EAL domain-containing protein (putative c-di-GMP-specific phosphodiesterase class I)
VAKDEATEALRELEQLLEQGRKLLPCSDGQRQEWKEAHFSPWYQAVSDVLAKQVFKAEVRLNWQSATGTPSPKTQGVEDCQSLQHQHQSLVTALQAIVHDPGSSLKS